MSSPRRFAPVGLALGALFALGCSSSVQATVTAQGAADLECPPPLTTPWIADSEHFVVRGCGRERAYECKLDKAGNANCTPMGEIAVRAARTGNPVKLTDASELDLALDAVEPQVLGCRPAASRIDVPYRVLAGTSSDGVRADGKEVSKTEASCVKATFLRAGIPDKVPHVDGDKHWSKSFTFSKERPRLQAIATPPPAASSTPVAESPSGVDEALETRVRARIAENAAAIVACAGKSPVAVEAAYDAEGKLTLALRGDEHGTPAERCIATALPGLAVEGSGNAGTLIHLVR